MKCNNVSEGSHYDTSYLSSSAILQGFRISLQHDGSRSEHPSFNTIMKLCIVHLFEQVFIRRSNHFPLAKTNGLTHCALWTQHTHLLLKYRTRKVMHTHSSHLNFIWLLASSKYHDLRNIEKNLNDMRVDANDHESPYYQI